MDKKDKKKSVNNKLRKKRSRVTSPRSDLADSQVSPDGEPVIPSATQSRPFSTVPESDSKNSGEQRNLLTAEPPPLPREILLLPLKEKPVFPGMFVPFMFATNPYEAIFKEIMEKRLGYVGMVLEKNPEEGYSLQTAGVEGKEFYQVGTLGRVVNIISPSAERVQAIISFTSRFSIQDVKKKDPVYVARIQPLEEMTEKDLESREKKDTLKGYAAALMAKVKELIKLNSVFSEELKILVSRYSSQSLPLFLNLLASLLTVPKPQELQRLLETEDLIEKILSLLDYLYREVEVFKVKDQINQQIEEKVSAQQRDFFLREQLKYIQKELGIGTNEKDLTLTKLEEKIRSLPLTQDARKVADAELEKLKLYDSKSGEFGVVKNYLDWILSLPWPQKKTSPSPDLEQASKVLDRHHYGLKSIKTKLLEFLAVEKLKKDTGGTILCFVGPPGVGKTSLGRSLAEAMGRKFYRFSVGGMRDEAEIKGHRRTYVGAMPGKIIQALKAVGTHNPVLLIDEIDKLTVGYQGDPSASLLEVLDPEQNRNFLDHYLDLPFDLSQVVFITTANQLETIAAPLRDRMEIIHLSSYVLEEKKNIAQKYLIPRQRVESGLQSGDFTFSPRALEDLIEYYTAEAGVRGLERAIRNLLHKVAYRKAFHPADFHKIAITPAFVEENIEESRIKDPFNHAYPLPGVVCGLAWTPLGGSILYIEAIVVEAQQTPGFKLTGQLGAVMEESAQIAYNYIRSLASLNKIFQIEVPEDLSSEKADKTTEGFFTHKQVHLHVPAGAIPKDGPSAGVAMALALASLAVGRGVKPDFAMTGELTLSGRVLPVGGLKEKLIAAKKNHKTRIIVPRDNQNDVKKIPPLYLKGIKVFYVDHFSEVFALTLGMGLNK